MTFSNVPILLQWYLKEKYNLSDEEVRKYIPADVEEDEPEDDD